MGDNKKQYGTGSLMVLTVIIIFCVIAVIVVGFRVIKKNEDARLVAASDTEYIQNKKDREQKIEAETKKDSEEQEIKNEDSDTGESFYSEEMNSVAADNTEDKVYSIKGEDKSSNRYERATHLSYTSTVRYTLEDLSLLDSYGLKITRNEIYARHGRMFNDRELQEYFQRQQWYVPQTASNDFDSSCLNEVERYNIELIKTYEEQVGGR